MMARKSRKHIDKPATPVYLPSLRAAAYLCTPKTKPTLSPEPVNVCDFQGEQQAFLNHNIRLISLSDQIVLLLHEVGNVNMKIEWQKFLIETLEPNVQKGIITPEESKELRFAFESKQKQLVKIRDQFLEQIQRIRSEIL